MNTKKNNFLRVIGLFLLACFSSKRFIDVIEGKNKPKDKSKKDCTNCHFKMLMVDEEPCSTCGINYSNFKQQIEI